jgi:hypothetical protein
MRVIVDATGLPWAVSYYKMFPFEPSRLQQDDMRFDKIVPLENPTFVDVLREMIAAAKDNETDVMFVCHGNPRGLFMSMSAAMKASADESTFKRLELVMKALALIDSTTTGNEGEGVLFAWASLSALLDKDQFNLSDASADARAAFWSSDFLKSAGSNLNKACDIARDRFKDFITQFCKAQKMSESDLREIADLTNQVRKASFKRIEVRSCNVGAGPGIAALHSFLRCERLMAPKVHTFYVPVNAPDTQQAQLEARVKRAGKGRWRFFFGDPRSYPFFDGPQAIVPGALNFMLSVTPGKVPKYSSEANRLNASVIQPWVSRYINTAARYADSAPLWVAGLDSPTPKGEPYTLPQDGNYRGLIAVASAAGVQ